MSEFVENTLNSKQPIPDTIESVFGVPINEIVSVPITDVSVPDVSVPDVSVILIDEITKFTFHQIFENFLIQIKDQNNDYNIIITPKMHTYFTLLCKENNPLFSEIESILKTIIIDDKIDIKDIPNIIVLVTKMYNTIKNDKDVPICDPYELIVTLLKVLIILYVKTNNIENDKLVGELDEIIKASTELIKLKAIQNSIFSCLKNLKLI
jgi:hypothetical protein